MPGLLTRKTRTPRGKLPATTSTSKFNQIAKLPAISKEAVKEIVPPAPRTTIEIVLTSRKRKAQDDTESASKKLRREPQAQPVAPATPVSRKRKNVRFADTENVPPAQSRVPSTPTTSRKRQLDSDETSEAGALLERLNLQSPISKRTKTTVHRRAPQNEFDLPRELLDLLDLHVAFLKTLSMQYAHSGTTSPVDLRTLYPSVTRTWGKRHVTLDDIQRCPGTPTKSTTTQSKTNAPYFLCDYGRDKICLEFHADAEPGPLREHKLNMDFEANLRTLWLSSGSRQPATIFIGTLPKAAIKPCASLAKVVGYASRNQTTLDSFKRDIALKKQQDQAAKEAATAQPITTPSSSSGGKLSLLDRIRLKESALAQLPAGASPAELARRAALERAVDVAAVISMLCKATAAGLGRTSFTMATLMVRLKDSMRVPVSAEDAALCVKLLAEEDR
ncbi:hypothetical protein N0V88_000927 [Collariella sp. IMI 366227]|nr:hypothetical protein N0V88_000927 [Collariella sp. IMI 366227]